MLLLFCDKSRERDDCFPGFDDKIIALYVRGAPGTFRAHILEIYGLSISTDLVSAVTEAVHDKVRRLAGTAAGVD